MIAGLKNGMLILKNGYQYDEIKTNLGIFMETQKGHLIINTKNNEYVFTNTETWDGDWKANYPHLSRLDDYCDIANPSIWEYDTINGFPFSYYNTYSGGCFTLYVDHDTSDEEIKKAKSALRTERDVVSLKVLKLKKVAA